MLALNFSKSQLSKNLPIPSCLESPFYSLWFIYLYTWATAFETEYVN